MSDRLSSCIKYNSVRYKFCVFEFSLPLEGLSDSERFVSFQIIKSEIYLNSWKTSNLKLSTNTWLLNWNTTHSYILGVRGGMKTIEKRETFHRGEITICNGKFMAWYMDLTKQAQLYRRKPKRIPFQFVVSLILKFD